MEIVTAALRWRRKTWEHCFQRGMNGHFTWTGYVQGLFSLSGMAGGWAIMAALEEYQSI